MCYVFTQTRAGVTPLRLSHSEIPGSQRVYRSPRLIAVSHVLHRLLAPRHPLCALCSLINLFRSRDCGTRDLLITETLGPGILPPGRYFQTQLLKVVFTTLYVDVKEPAPNFFGVNFLGYFRRQKNPTLSSDSNHVSVHHAGTKLSSNLQSQNTQEPTPLAFA